jgi:para-nitrobenzyl esterase
VSANLHASLPASRDDGADSLSVAVDGGLIAGLREPQGGVRAFLGIPYAAPPLGPLRWRPPQPVAGWRGLRPARALAPQCLQPGRPADSVYAEYAGVQPMSEDCLYLNVWSAAPDADARWPVMVWFHGGAFQQGAGSNPVFVRGDLPRHGVVLVTFNYRLGPFGFMAHPALSAESAQGASGNYGLLDMAAALGWVRRNIAAFGGDPDCVTIFGQSAGAAGIVDMMAAPRTRGLFARAIAQSFGITRMSTLAEAERSGAAFAERNGATGLAPLRELDGKVLLARYLERPERWMPIVDGDFVERPVREIFADGRQDPVPFMTGWNADEGTTFAAAADAAEFRARLRARFGERAGEAEKLYPCDSDANARAASLELIGDELFASGVWRAARDQARIAPTYVYHFDHRQPFGPQQRFHEAEKAADLGVFHSAEYPYVFGSTAVLTRAWGGADRRMTELMQAWWLQFARQGNPNRPELPYWPQFVDDAATATVMRLAADPGPIDVPRRSHLAFADRAT